MDALNAQVGEDPCSQLWLAVLEFAAADYALPLGPRIANSSSGYQRWQNWYWRQNARLWVLGPGFRQVCELLDLRPAWVRRQLERYRRDAEAERTEKARQTHAQAA